MKPMHIVNDENIHLYINEDADSIINGIINSTKPNFDYVSCEKSIIEQVSQIREIDLENSIIKAVRANKVNASLCFAKNIDTKSLVLMNESVVLQCTTKKMDISDSMVLDLKTDILIISAIFSNFLLYNQQIREKITILNEYYMSLIDL